MKFLRLAVERWRIASSGGEQSMALNRTIVGIFALCFNYWAKSRGLMSGCPVIAPCVYLLVGAGITLHLLARPLPDNRRRFAAMLLDCGAASYELHIGGAATVWQFAGYLWIIFGNGFRFGARFQIYTMSAATVGFLIMAIVTPFWRDQPAQLFGGIVSLTVVPLYALALINRLSRAIDQAEEASRAKSLFLASVSHELRTPLNAIIGMGALLENSDLKHDQIHMSRTIVTAGRSLLSLIDGVLDLSRAESGRAAETRTDFDLAQLLYEIKTIFVGQAGLKGVHLNLHIAAQTPLFLNADARKLHEILLNLVGNAMKFTATGSIAIAVDVVSQQDAQVRLRFEVTDTGIGIAPEAQEHIFETFTQADDTIVNRFGGTGLGLALVRTTVQLLGGEVGVESELGAGSTFWLELPMLCQPANAETVPSFSQLRAYVYAPRLDTVAPLLGRLTKMGVDIEHIDNPRPDWPAYEATRWACLFGITRIDADSTPYAFNETSFVPVLDKSAEALPKLQSQRSYASVLNLASTDAELCQVLHFVSTVASDKPAHVDRTARPAPREKLNLLVADDNATNRYVMEAILRSAGHSVTLVTNGEEALDALAEGAFDAVILDINMPVMGGIEATQIYRMTTNGSRPSPVIALTADATPGTRARCLEVGMAACLVKPIEPDRLLSLLEEVTGGDRALNTAPVAADDPRISKIDDHPRFRSNVQSAVDADVLERLHNLGGEDFVAEVANLFCSEANALLQELRTASAQGDVLAFRTHVHGLRSVAANIGASQLCHISLPFQNSSAIELQQFGPSWLDRIEAELRRIDIELTAYNSAHAKQRVP